MKVRDIKAAVRERDGFCCVECGMTAADHLARYGKTLQVHRLSPGKPYSIDGCVALCIPCHAPKPRSPYGTFPNGAPIDAEVMRVARIVASYEGVSIAELLSETLRPLLLQKLAHHQAKGVPESKKPRPR